MSDIKKIKGKLGESLPDRCYSRRGEEKIRITESRASWDVV